MSAIVPTSPFGPTISPSMASVRSRVHRAASNRIDPGQAVEFSTWTPHWFGVVDGPVEAIVMFGPHGERLHLHS